MAMSDDGDGCSKYAQRSVSFYDTAQCNIPKHSHLYIDSYYDTPDFYDMSSFLWYVIDNVRVRINFVHDTLDIEMYILQAIFFGYFL
jgi:hypothetical protein